MSIAYFAMYAHSEKTQGVGRVDHGGHRGLFGGMWGKEEARGAIWVVISNSKAKEQTTPPKKTKTSTHKLM